MKRVLCRIVVVSMMSFCLNAFSMNITKTVIPAAGLGTRFLPFTKIIPKEMLPLGNRPAIEYIIEEGMASGLDQFLMIVNKDKQAIVDHFSPALKLEKALRAKNKLHLLNSTKKIQENAKLVYIEQPVPLGLGHAVYMAHEVVGDEYFCVQLPDDLIWGADPGLAQLIAVAKEQGASVIAVQEVPEDKVSSYGIVAPKKEISSDLVEIATVVEKPKPEDAPSNLGIIGRYVLSPKIFKALEHITPGAGGELQLTDGIEYMMRHYNEKVYAYKIKGTRHDIGVPKGWLKALNDMVLD